jgi:hypothetical protein
MASDYQAIRRDNERRYGTDIGRIGPMLLADRYADRTHFIFELLQNAEDALGRRKGWKGSRSISFHLSDAELRIEHFGLPFDEADVRGICGIAESTKDLTAIGRFGIGFKSVYAVTSRPEIHSGAEAFAIDNFVWPVSVPAISRDPDATVIVIPLANSDERDCDELARGLVRLDPSALLFLRHIEEIRWSVEGGLSGLYLRESTEAGAGVRRVTVIGQEYVKPDVAEEWLIFSQAVSTDDGRQAGYVELAFSLQADSESRRDHITRIEHSPLVVFFPTVVETHLGFLVQGPYRTTPSRDNVPRGDAWNQHLVRETAALLGRALRWQRDNGFLDTAALQCLPLDPAKFAAPSMFAPIYEATKLGLSTDALLPRFDAGHAPSSVARLGRTQEVRDLLTPAQLGTLYDEAGELVWLSGDITQDRTPALRRYLMQELEIPELTPEPVVQRLDQRFLEAQSDEWIVRLYEFLNGQSGLRWRYEDLPLIRLEDGSHVPARLENQPRAFLPGPIASGFPLVRAAICMSAAALAFLRSLGLTEPDPVDDVVRNVLPKYREDEVDVSDEDYEADISRIVHAFSTDSAAQREKLLTALRETEFVMAVDPSAGTEHVARPGELYVATERLKELFASTPGVLLTDDRYACLRGENVRKLLEECGAIRYLRPIPGDRLSWTERLELRVRAGKVETSGQNDRVTDWSLLGLDALLDSLPRLESEARRTKAQLIWEELANLEERRGKGVFAGEYSWTHYGNYRTTFDAAFVRVLNTTAWVPDANGDLQPPELILFESLGWKPSPFLQSKIRFKPPIIDQLATEAGIEPGLLDLLKKRGITSEAQLRELLGVEGEEFVGGDEPGQVDDALKHLGITEPPTPPVPDPASEDRTQSAGGGSGAGQGTGAGSGSDRKPGGGEDTGTQTVAQNTGAGSAPGRRIAGSAGGRPFISYVAAHPDEEEPDLDGLDQAARMALEEKAIALILSREPQWRSTPTHNPGFDLYQGNELDDATEWCEVKAMTGRLADRPVGLSHTQFQWAREHGEAYWLYVVECAGTDEARLVRIQNPAGKARTFTFDHGWLDVAETDSEEES